MTYKVALIKASQFLFPNSRWGFGFSRPSRPAVRLRRARGGLRHQPNTHAAAPLPFPSMANSCAGDKNAQRGKFSPKRRDSRAVYLQVTTAGLKNVFTSDSGPAHRPHKRCPALPPAAHLPALRGPDSPVNHPPPNTP